MRHALSRLSPTRLPRAARPLRISILLVLVLGMLPWSFGALSIPAAHAATTPSISLSPTSGYAPFSSAITVSGSGFSSTVTLTINVDNVNKGTITTTAGGTFSGFTVTPSPAWSTAGTHTVQASGDTTAPTATFTVLSTPTLSVSEAMSGAAMTLTLTGSNLPPGDTLNLTAAPVGGGSSFPLCTAAINGSGTPAASCTPSTSLTSGTYNITASGTAFGPIPVSGVTLTITPVLLFSPTAATSSSTPVTFTGYGFPANDAVTIKVDSITVASTTTSGTGTLSPIGAQVFSVVPSGTYTPAMSDGSGALTITTSSLTVGTGSTGGTLTLYPSSGPVGTYVTASASGLTSGTTVYLYFNGTQQSSALVSGGAATAYFYVPSVANYQSYTVQFRDSSLSTVLASNTFYVNPTSTGTATVTLVPSSGPVGQFVTVTGNGFAAYQQSIQLTVNGTNYGTNFQANVYGTVTATFAVPNVAYGSSLAVTLAVSGGISGTAYFTVSSSTGGSNSLTLSPTSGAAGTTVTAYGYTSTASQTVIVQLLYNNAYVNLAQTTSGSNSYYSTTFQIPNILSGTYPVYLNIGGSLTSTLSSLTVNSGTGLTLTPSSGPAGTSVTVTGSGFPAYSSVTITFAGSYVATTSATASGTYSATFTVPSYYTSGTQTVTATSSTAGYVAYGYFTIGTSSGLINLTLTPSTGVVGTMITASGYGSGPYLPIVITYGGTQVATTSTNSGNYYSATFTVPAYPTGAVTVQANETTYGYIASATFNGSGNANISLTLSPTSGPGGTTVTASGTVSATGQVVNISIGSNQVAAPVSNASGTYSATFTVPSGSAAGALTVTASQPTYGYTTSTTFTVSAAPQISLSSSTAAPGTTITLKGSGFVASEGITITLPGGTTTSASADSSGNLSAQVTIPAGTAAGTATISALGASSKAKVSASITITSPVINTNLAFTTPGGVVTLRGSGFVPGEVVALSASNGANQTVTADTTGAFITTFGISAAQPAGSITFSAHGATSSVTVTASLTVIVPKTATPTKTPTATPTPVTTPTPAKGGSTDWYIPSGRTNGGYGEQINITNPNNQTVTGNFTFYYVNGKGQNLTKLYPFTVKPNAAGYFNISRIAPALPAVGARIVADQRIQVVVIVKYKNGPWSALSGYGRERTFWSLAGGTLPERLDLLNTTASTAHVLVTWGQGKGNKPIQLKVTLAPNSQMSLAEAKYLKQPPQGTSVKSDVNIAVAHTTAVG